MGAKDETVKAAERDRRAVEQHLKVEQKLRDANKALEKALEEAEERVRKAEAKVAETVVVVGETGATAHTQPRQGQGQGQEPQQSQGPTPVAQVESSTENDSCTGVETVVGPDGSGVEKKEKRKAKK